MPAELKTPQTRLAAVDVETAAPPPHRAHAVGVVSVLTVVVAVFGYLREATLAARFGLSTTMDAYFGAIFIPTMVYMVLIAGTLSPVFIPILMREDLSDGRARLSDTFSVVTNVVLLFLAVIVAAAVITAHQWLRVLFPGFDAATMAATAHLVYIIFPSVVFVALSGLLAAVLNGFHKFALAAFAPALSSLAVIAAALLARGPYAIYLVSIATAVGFLLQLLVLIPATAALGIRYRPLLKFRHPAVAQLVRMGGPLFLYLAVANGVLFLERNLASSLAPGAVSTLTYAMRLFAVPANFLAAPLAIVSYPLFAREAARTGYGDLRTQVSRAFRIVTVLFLPITVWTVLNALPLTRLIFERGHFQLADSLVTAGALRMYSIGILPNAIAVILLRCFYAVEDTITPLLAEILDLALYALVARIITRHFGLQGLAFTRGISFFLVTGVLVYVLVVRRKLFSLNLDLLRFALKTSLATLGMGAVSWMCLRLFQSSFDAGNIVLRTGVVFLEFTMSGAAFLGVARLLGLSEAAHILKTVCDLVLLRRTPGNSAEISANEVSA